MSETRFVRFVKGRYWLTLTHAAEHPYKVFQDRHEAKTWLVDHGMGRSNAETLLLDVAQKGTVTKVQVDSEF